MVTWQSMMSLSRWENFVTSTAVPWGISLSRLRSSFSRTISAMICRSGWSVTTSSGKSWGPSGIQPERTESSSSTPSPVRAEMGTTAVQSKAAAYTAMTPSSFSFSTVSILLMTRAAGTPRVLMRPMSSASASPMRSMGSTSSITPSTSATDWRATFTI